LIKNIRDINFYLFYESGFNTFVLEYWFNSKRINYWEFKFAENFARGRELEELIRNIIRCFDIDIVHFHHLLGLPLTLLEIPKKLKKKSIYTCHDFYLIDKSIFLIKKEGKPISEFYENIEDYKYNLIRCKGNLNRLKYIKELLKSVDKIITPSNYLSNSIKLMFGIKNVKTIEHGISFDKLDLKNYDIRKKIKVAFLGVTAPHKGILDFIDLLKNSELRKKFRWIILGYDKVYDEYLSDLSYYKKYIEIVNKYDREYISKILREKEVDLVLLLSKCLESFSFTLSESIQCNIPVIGRDIGIIGERIKREKLGWTFRTNSELIEILKSLNSNRNLLYEKTRYISSIKMKMISQNADEYKDMYNRMITSTKVNITDGNINKWNRFFFEKSYIEREIDSMNIEVTNEKRSIPLRSLNTIKNIIKKIPFFGDMITWFYRLFSLSNND
jgi:glycosyltransferase involved in cell wall biosynthesis